MTLCQYACYNLLTIIHEICLFVCLAYNEELSNQNWHTGTSSAPGGSYLYQIISCHHVA